MEAMELIEIDVDRKGNKLPPKHNKKIIIDADTIAYQVCRQKEELVEWSELDDKDLLSNVYPSDEEGYYVINEEDAIKYAIEKVQIILDYIGGKKENTRCYFTGTRTSFRYDLLKKAFPKNLERHYKARRKDKRAPAGLSIVKKALLDYYGGNISNEWEADDEVVMLKRKYGENAILVALDKDVLYNVPGKHWNYYENKMYGKEQHWVEIEKDVANFNQYLQVITGDKSDNVPGLYKIGPKKAMKWINPGMTEKELWDGVLQAYKEKCDYGDPEEMAILNMQLVSMRQLTFDYEIKLWYPEFDSKGDHKWAKV